jgi:thiosulfate dehydrogenase
VRWLVVLALLAACTSTESGAEYGDELFHDRHGLSASSLNAFSCADCHQTSAEASDRIMPGASMVGVAARERWWGGQTLSLLDAVDTCLVYFMRAEPLARDSDESRALHEYLLSLTPADAASDIVPMTVVENVVAVPLGDAARGEEIYERTCQHCHGEVHTAEGKIFARDVVLPEIADDYDQIFPGVPHGLVVTEVVRHGRFFGVGGTMPFFTSERLSDAQLGDLLAFLGLPTS